MTIVVQVSNTPPDPLLCQTAAAYLVKVALRGLIGAVTCVASEGRFNLSQNVNTGSTGVP